jgi:hypothetical protein
MVYVYTLKFKYILDESQVILKHQCTAVRHVCAHSMEIFQTVQEAFTVVDEVSDKIEMMWFQSQFITSTQQYYSKSSSHHSRKKFKKSNEEEREKGIGERGKESWGKASSN